MKNDYWGFVNTNGQEVIPIYSGKISFEGEEVSPNDTLNHIRELYPLYGMFVLGDFKENCACIQDEFALDSEPNILCINKIGKFQQTEYCKPFTKIADVFNPQLELNSKIQVIKTNGEWLKIDKSGNIVK
jgi:hypothetical protein